ncbi:molybdopterin-dependent oxidoreductase [Nakamurella sp.]|uniref:molybdopterin-dependent oxidoreductase n=1 Tax=Nakamurella sp. TaxID=1869182 RepID=UPI003B3A6EAB
MTTSERLTGTPGKAEKPRRRGYLGAAAAGVVAVGLTLGVAELLSALGRWAGFLGASSSPFVALGQTFIQFTPEWLKELAIRTFGEHDKDALTAGMVLTVLVVAVAIGLINRSRPRVAVALTGLLIAVAAAAVLTRPGADALDLIPLLVGGVLGVAFLIAVARAGLGSTGAAAGRDHGNAPDPAAAAGGPGTTGRRRFLALVGGGALVAVAAGGLARLIPSAAQVAQSRGRVALPTPADRQDLDVDGTVLDVAGLTPFVTANADFYRVDTAYAVPALTTDEWQLRVHGAVDREITLGFDDLLALPAVERMITLTCVSNEVGGKLAGNARWQGVRLADLLAMAGPQDGADCVLSTSVDGFTVTTPLAALIDGRDALLAYAMNGEPLPVEHGFPVRMVVPGLYGYVSATKWVVDLELTRFADVSAYWTDRGWSAQAPIKTASRIDVPAGFARLSPGTVAVAGVAWAQHRGISAVQVQIDDGPWQDATLSGELTVDIWRQWSFTWPATEPGLHTIRCRAIDADGTVQTDQIQGVMPDGSTGYDSRQVTVTA